jgi:hypothetical protein
VLTYAYMKLHLSVDVSVRLRVVKFVGHVSRHGFVLIKLHLVTEI